MRLFLPRSACDDDDMWISSRHPGRRLKTPEELVLGVIGVHCPPKGEVSSCYNLKIVLDEKVSLPLGELWGTGMHVKNISGQPITGARIGLGLPETKKERSLGFSLEYGKGLSTGILSDEQQVIVPEEEFELRFDDAQYQRYKKFVAERSSLSSFSQVWIGVTTVKFEDGSFWSSGCLPSSNPSNSCTPHAP